MCCQDTVAIETKTTAVYEVLSARQSEKNSLQKQIIFLKDNYHFSLLNRCFVTKSK